MWVEIICGIVIYQLVCHFFSDDEFSDVETSDSTALFSVAHKLEKLYGGKAYVGLQIPDADTASRQHIDLVLVTKGEVVVIAVKNLSGIVTVTSDGIWVCEGLIKDFDSKALDTLNSQDLLSGSLDRLVQELDQLLKNAPLPFIVQHASRISIVKQRVSSLNLALKSIQRRINNIDHMFSANNITQEKTVSETT